MSRDLGLFDVFWREAERRHRLNRSRPLPVWRHFAAVLAECGFRLVVSPGTAAPVEGMRE